MDRENLKCKVEKNIKKCKAEIGLKIWKAKTKTPTINTSWLADGFPIPDFVCFTTL